MTFRIEKITLHNFRSYKQFSLEFDPYLTILYGPNAIGKTNLIEALQLVTEGISFRNPSWEDVVFHLQNDISAEIFMNATGDGRKREVSFESKNGKKTLKANGKVVRSYSTFSGAIPNILFTPQDLLLISSSSEKRRTEIDNFGAQLSKKYAQLKTEYRRVLLQRNKLLKEEVVDPLLMDVLNHQLIEYGSALMFQRIKLLCRLYPYIIDIYKHIDKNAPLSMVYVSKVFPKTVISLKDEKDIPSLEEIKKSFRNEIESRKRDEMIRHHTLVGPHRDDIEFLLHNKEAKIFGSQGQIRSITLAWKIAEVKVCEEILGIKPILLLDDVMSELDENRRNSLTHLVGEVAQTIITTANIGYFTPQLLKKAKVINIEEALSNER